MESGCWIISRGIQRVGRLIFRAVDNTMHVSTHVLKTRNVHSAHVTSARSLSDDGSRRDFNHLYFRAFKRFLLHSIDILSYHRMSANIQKRCTNQATSKGSMDLVLQRNSQHTLCIPIPAYVLPGIHSHSQLSFLGKQTAVEVPLKILLKFLMEQLLLLSLRSR